jgi:cytochrome oxidase assembly protein ShyY1
LAGSGTFVAEMYRFLLRPKWIAFHALCLGGIVLMLGLAMWQLQRLDERQAFNAQVVARSEQPAVDIDELLAEPDFEPDEAAWRQVTASGTWLPQQIIVFNRTQDGVAGDNVVAALVQDDGVTVLVNRGFVPLGTMPPPPPSGSVEVLGTVRPSQERRTGELTDDGLAVTEVRRIDIDQLAAQLPGEVAPVYLDLVASEPAIFPTDPAPVPAPDLSEGPHLSYAGQWFIFAVCVAIGWVFAVRRSIRARRRQALETDVLTVEGGEPGEPGSPTPTSASSTTTTI